MSNVWEHYAVLIVTGAILAAVALLRNLVSNIVTQVFSKVSIFGNWETTIDRGQGPVAHEDVTLRQLIHRVRGIAKAKNGNVEYRLQGRISGDLLCLIYRQARPAGFDVGASLLTMEKSGQRMHGYEVGVDAKINTVYSYSYEWTKRP